MNNIVAGAHDRVFSTKYGVQWHEYPLHSQRADCLLGGACFAMRAATESRLRRSNF
jgi:hypothetical protein